MKVALLVMSASVMQIDFRDAVAVWWVVPGILVGTDAVSAPSSGRTAVRSGVVNVFVARDK